MDKLKRIEIKNIKHVYFDMDGTLLTSNKDVSHSSLETINKLKNLGITVSIATGRPYYLAKKEINLLKIDTPIISCNGALIYSPKDDKIIFSNSINKTNSKLIFDILLKHKATFLVYTTEQIFRYKYNKTSEWFDWLDKTNNSRLINEKFKMSDILNPNEFNIEEFEIIKFLIVFSEISKEQNDKIVNDINLLTSVYLVQSQANVLDVMPQESTKGKGLMILNDKKIIDLDKTIVFGDADNDISMFKVSKYSVAMGQANDKLKKHSTHITNDNNNEGISNFFKNLIN